MSSTNRRDDGHARACYAVRLWSMLFVLFPMLGFGKDVEKPRSFSLQEPGLQQVQLKVVPKLNIPQLLEEDRLRKEPGPQRFGVPIDTDFSTENSSTWQNLSDGRLWRLRIRSEEARSLYVVLTRVEMSEHTKLWVYSPDRKSIRGPYTMRQRGSDGRLWTALVLGPEIVVEIFVPTSEPKALVQIGSVGRGYRGLADAASCQIDVACTEGNGWQQQASSVAKITLEYWVSNNVKSSGTCTGTMLNNNTSQHLLLTAHHCGLTLPTYVGGSAKFYFNYQRPNCGSGNPIDHDQQGFTPLVSDPDPGRDLLLLALTQSPGVFYSGWDATGATGASGATQPSSVGIHHPKGDAKKINVRGTAPVSYMGGNDFWEVDWDEKLGISAGGMEDGSSGSCLFGPHKKCIGVYKTPSITAACSVSQKAYYKKLSTSWSALPGLRNALAWGTGAMSMDGDPHITTTNDKHYDFQAAGEFVALRDPNGLEVQVRQTAVPTSSQPGRDPNTDLAACVSVNTAFAARVGKYRVTYQPNLDGTHDPKGLKLRVDGFEKTPTPEGIDLGDGASVSSVGDSNALKVVFPDQSVAFVTPGWWPEQKTWYLNVSVVRSPMMGGTSGAENQVPRGITAAIPSEGWLPDLPDGTPMGPRPAAENDRYIALYKTFSSKWRVTGETALFDYAGGKGTEFFTDKDWPPPPGASCNPAGAVPHNPTTKQEAQAACEGIKGEAARRNCVFDVLVTGHKGFAKTYVHSQRIFSRATKITLDKIEALTRTLDIVELIATVGKAAWNERGIPTGKVQFFLNGLPHKKPVALDAKGQATCRVSRLKPGDYQLSAQFIPSKGSNLAPSSTASSRHTVK